jgi:phosphopantothenoylcysteine decarboxylase/phosphopantothenate--cysteine ligase
MRLAGRKIALGITGSIAAYKAAALCRLLVSEGADVRVVMTPAATAFISPLTLSVFSGNSVWVNFTTENKEWNNHVELGLWADLLLIAPASANTLSGFAHGACHRLLDAVYLSARCPVIIAPAMDHDMFLHPATGRNLAVLEQDGVTIIPPDEGSLASGLTGKGRMKEPEQIVEVVVSFLNTQKWFLNKNVLVSAGPTREALDPVRYISNHSSGKMGVALAEAFSSSGANVTLVAGPLQVSVPAGIKHIPVVSAEDMYVACKSQYSLNEITVMSAAVADYTPISVSAQKIKKDDGDEMQVLLKKTKDILSELGKLKQPHQFLVGFALETNNEMAHARRKLETKNLDMIVLNSLKDEGAGFGHETNKVSLLLPNNKCIDLPLLSKRQTAREIVRNIAQLRNAV